MTGRNIHVGFGFGPKTAHISRNFINARGLPLNFSTTGAPAAPNPVGINVQNNTSSGGLPLFQDRTREAAGFYVSPSNQTQTTVDANGWPTTDTFIALVDGASTQTWNNGSGTWKCGFTCNTPSAASTVSVTGSGGATCTVTSRNASTGYVSFDMTVNGSGGPNITGTSNGITNIFNYLPGYGTSTISGGLYQYSSTSLFTTEAINHYGSFGCLRFMWLQNAWNNTTSMTDANRHSAANTKFQSAPFGHTNDGMPYEWLVDMCVAFNTDGWFCTPARYDSTWLTAFANYLAAHMPAGKTAHIEFVNEIWNGTGNAVALVNADATSAGLSLGAYLGKKLGDMQPTFSSAYGSRFGTDLQIVAMDQTGANGFGRIVNATIPYVEANYGTASNYIHVLGCAPYMTRDLRVNNGSGQTPAGVPDPPGDNVNHINSNDTIAQIQSQLTTNGTYIGFLSYSERYKVTALAKNLKMKAYESGWESGSETTAVTNMGAAIMDTGMTAVVTNYLDKTSPCGFDAMMIFQSGVYVGGNVLDPGYSESTSFANIATAPRYLGYSARFGGWQFTHRNTVNGATTIDGRNYVDNDTTITTAYPNFATFSLFSPPIHYATGFYLCYLIYCTAPKTYALSVNFTTTSSGTTNVEVNGGNVVSTGIAISNGLSNSAVACGNVPLVQGFNYIGLGNGTNQPNITVNSLTLT